MKSKYQNDQKANFGNEHSLFAVEALTEAITLTAEDSGKFYTVDAAGGAYVITLPSPTTGIRYDFAVVEDTPSNAVTITATGALIYGRVLEGEVDTDDDAPGSSGATGQTSFIIGTAANRGDSFRLVCDGTYWYAQGVSALDGSFTVA
jgi:hypothetical protein|tara:strand:+ start:167 stop:610 length:444 start_codon:yes stop_codon:yes gene_type:complete